MIAKNVKQQEANHRQLVILVSTVFIWKTTNVPSVNCLAPFVHRKKYAPKCGNGTYLTTVIQAVKHASVHNNSIAHHATMVSI